MGQIGSTRKSFWTSAAGKNGLGVASLVEQLARIPTLHPEVNVSHFFGGYLEPQ